MHLLMVPVVIVLTFVVASVVGWACVLLGYCWRRLFARPGESQK